MATQMPRTPVGEQLSWVLDRLLKGLAGDAEAAERFSTAFLETFPVDTILSIGQQAVALLGDIEVVDVEPEDDLRATVTVRGSSELRALIRASVEPSAPHRLAGLGFTPAPPPSQVTEPKYDVIVLNGVSSSGKSTIARALQASLELPWLHAEVDAFLRMLPAKGLSEIITVARGANAAVAALAGEGNRVIFDCVLGGELVEDLRAKLAGTPTLWVGVHCAADVLAERERERGDRMIGQAQAQLAGAHQGLTYDVEVDTTSTSAETCARQICDVLIGD